MDSTDFKLYYDLDFPNSNRLYWYTGLYLGLTRVFMGIVRKKIVQSPDVEAVLIPVHRVPDPVTKKIIEVNITNRYFFIGTKIPLVSEENIGIKTHSGTITMLRNDNGTPKQIAAADIQKIIQTHKHRKRDTIQERVPVMIKRGTFKNWEGIVIAKPQADPELVKVNFSSDDYSLALDIPVALCELA